MSRPTPEMLRRLMRYEPETGILFWKERTSDLFEDGKQSSEHRCKRWNSKLAGKEALIADSDGYKMGSIFNKKLYSHRVILAMINNEWPDGETDHINHNRKDNRIANLRIVSHQGNQKNMSLHSEDKSGFCGVFFYKPSGKWRATINSKGKCVFLGYFDKKSDAIEARMTANIKYHFHELHERAA